jgi:hypothetical protein
MHQILINSPSTDVMDLSLGFQILGVLLSAAAPVLFAAPRLPYLKEYVRPSKFEEGWYTLRVQRQLNYDDPGFDKVLRFLIGHSFGEGEGHFVDVVADDLGIESEEILSGARVPEVEELRILTKPTYFSEHILICYDEETGGPLEESDESSYHGLPKLNTDDSGDDWRWFGPLSAVEYNALRYMSEEIDRWTSYGAVALGFGVLFQLISIIIS